MSSLQNKNDNKKETLKELRQLVYEADLEGIDNWFINNFDSKTKKEKITEEDLVNYIFNNSYFFSWQSSGVMNISYIEQEEVKRYHAIFKHLSLESRLSIFNNLFITNIKPYHIELFKTTEAPVFTPKAIEEINLIITKLFFEENLDNLDNLLKITHYNPTENPSCRFILMYREEYSTGGKYFYLKHKIINPFYDIIYNLTENKVKYLNDRNIPLPDEKNALLISEHLVNYILSAIVSTPDTIRSKERIEWGLDNYLKYLHYVNLDSELQKNNQHRIKCKI